MKVLGIAFSYRKDGNCSKCLNYILKRFEDGGNQTEYLNIFDYDISPCSNCNYACFYGNMCSKKDDMDLVVKKCINSDIIIYAFPTYRGHLPSSYFAFSERLEAFFRSGPDFEDDFLRKINMIVFGNLSAGGDMALHEAFSDFANRTYSPEAVLLSSREYDKKSIDGNLIEDELVKARLDKLANDILKKKDSSK